MSRGPAYDAILFDFDGVLMDTEPVHFACWREVLLPLGVPMDWDSYAKHCIGVADYTMLEWLGARAAPPVAAERMWREYTRKNQLFVARMQADPPMPEDTRLLLTELSGYKLAVVSSSGRSEVETILAASGVRPHFQAVICSEDVARHKPDPEPYRKAAALLGARTPLVVEDSEPGAQSGLAAGFDVVRIDSAAHTARLVRERIRAE